MRDEIKYSLANIWDRKLRSSLTILSILIGITSIFALVSFGLGIQHYVNVLAEESGSNTLFIMAKGMGAPGTDSNFFFTSADLDYVKKINGVDEVMGMYFKVAEVESRGEKKYPFFIGYDPKYQTLVDNSFTVTVNKGRTLKNGEFGKVLLGHNYQIDQKIFKKAINLGDKISINGEEMKVVGFYEEVGNPGDDSNLYTTKAEMERLYPDIKDKFGYGVITAEKNVNPHELAEVIQEKLRKHKGQEKGKEDFYVQTYEDLLATFGSVINILNGILIIIALVSLVVASVNIMNTMYTAVLERTKEIGVMKAIGAPNNEIMFIFIFESGLLGLIGGILGVILGYLIASAGGSIAASAGYSALYPIFPWYLTLGCILFATIVGAASGYLPAKQASQLKPVDALRYE